MSTARAKTEVRERIEQAAYELAKRDIERWNNLVQALADLDAQALEVMLSADKVPDETLAKARARAQAFREITKLLRDAPQKVTEKGIIE